MSKFKVITFCLLMAFVFAIPAYADMTVDQKTWVSLGNKRMLIAQVDFDSSYVSGGESFDYTKYGFTKVDSVKFSSKNGITFDYDYTNKKIKAYFNAPPIVYEEKHTATATAGFNLDYPAAWIVNVADSSGNSLRWVYSGSTPWIFTTDQFRLTAAITEGAISGVTVDAADDYYVTYVTQAWKEIYDSLVQNEVVPGIGIQVSGASNALVSGNTMFAFGYAYNTVGNVNSSMTPYSFNQAPAHAFGVTCYAASGNSAFYINATNSGATLHVTYLKNPKGSGWLVNNINAGTSSVGVQATYEYFQKPMLIPLVSGNVLAGSNAPRKISLERPSTLPSGHAMPNWHNYAVFDWPSGQTVYVTSGLTRYVQRWDNTGSGVSLQGNYLSGVPWAIPDIQPIEVKNGTNLSNITNIRMEIIGH